MGKAANAAIWEQFKPDTDLETEDGPLNEADFEESYSDWKWNKDDDLATAVRRYAMPMPHVRLFDECGVGR
jgi:hypothetical protein